MSQYFKLFTRLLEIKSRRFPRIDWNKTALLAADFSVSGLSSLKQNLSAREASRSQALLPTYTLPGLLLFLPVACGKHGKSGASASLPAAQHYPVLVFIVSPGACGIPGIG